jgi:type I restriction enzyme S subunit
LGSGERGGKDFGATWGQTIMAINGNDNRWLNDLPQRWETRFLKHKLRKITDGAHVSPDTSESAYPFVSTVDIQNGTINFESCLQTSAENYSMLSSQGCRPKVGDVLFSKDGTVGRTALIFFDKDFVVASSLIILTPQQAEVFPGFLDFMLRSHFVLEQINSFVKGSALKRVSLLNIKKVIGVFPPVEEQIRIAAYLDKTCASIDKAVDAKQKQLGILDSLRKSIIHKAVTRGLDDSVELKDSGVEWLGRIPIHWNVYRLRDITSKIGSGVTPEGGASSYVDEGIPLFRSQNIHFDGLRLDDIALITEEQHNSMSNTKVQGGDVLLNITGASLGRCHYVPKDFGDANVNQHVCIIRTYRKLYFEFLNFFLSSDTGQKQIFSGFRGASREGLNFREIKNFLLPIPLEKEQVEICHYLDKKFEKFELLKNNLENQIATLEQYRKSLIHECVTGKRRITEDDVQGQL